MPREKLQNKSTSFLRQSVRISFAILKGILGLFVKRYIVSGHSMETTFFEGDRILASPSPYFFKGPKEGDIVVAKRREGKTFYIKRISRIEFGMYLLIGDNPHDSYDSRKFGTVTRNEIKGKVIAKL